MPKSKVVACIIARTVSTRLPLKVLRDIGNGMGMLDFLITRVKAARRVDEVYICTSTEAVDDILEDVAARNGVNIYRGSADQVIERMLSVGALTNADIVLRITGDNPFTSFEYIDAQVEHLEAADLDYVRVTDVPVGATAEVIRLDALKRCNEMMDPSVSEYLMLFLFEPKHFKCGVIRAFGEDYYPYSLTVDTPQDLQRSRLILKHFAGAAPEAILLKDIMKLYTDEALDIPHRKLAASGNVKLPYGKTVPFETFKADMDRRINESVMVTEYEK